MFYEYMGFSFIYISIQSLLYQTNRTMLSDLELAFNYFSSPHHSLQFTVDPSTDFLYADLGVCLEKRVFRDIIKKFCNSSWYQY